jgi:TRAP-type C4-dicarboxylate transport system permease small subunit
MPIQKWNDKLEFISNKLAYLGSIALFIMMLLTTADVIGRYFFNRPVLGALEITEFLVLILIFSFLAHSQAKKSHVSVDLLVQHLPKWIRTAIDITNHILCLGFMALIVRMGFLRAMEIREFGEATNNLRIVKYPFALFVVFGCTVLCVEYLRDLIRLLIETRKGGHS